MRKLAAVCIIVVVMLSVSAFAQTGCTPIKSGTITDVNGNPIKMGYDVYGYNYQAHLFNGLYENFSRPSTPFTAGDLNLVMKWSDNWLSNQDCNNDGKLDRGMDPKTGVSTGTSLGWVTNHFEGECTGDDGITRHFTENIKIVYVGPAPVAPAVDSWADTRIWGLYAIVEQVGDDMCTGFKGIDKSRFVNPFNGLGHATN